MLFFSKNKKLEAYLNTRLRESVPREVIEKELAIAGWSEKEVQEAFYRIFFPKNYRKNILGASLLLVVVFFIFLLFLFFQSKGLNYTINFPFVTEGKRLDFSYGEIPALSNPDFFSQVKKQFISEQSDFIEADLSAMKLRVYKKGQLALEVPITSKGREGSWWQTPAGLYKINSKTKEHFSSIGHVWMPWSMNFQGNFFIHGQTYYPDGTLTSSQYSGGCIRLATDDAKKVFNSVDVGLPVLVFENSFSSDNFDYAKAIPSLSTQVYLSADLRNNHVFTGQNSTKIIPIASITKLMTALIATEYINLDNVATVPKEAIIYTSKPRFKAGDRFSIYQLLFPLLMESSNESAETIARYYGRENFIKHMNNKAVSIGMANTNFDDPSGVSALNTSTAEDLFMLAKYIYNNRSFIFNISSGKIKGSAYGSNGFSDLVNLNDFVGEEFFFGGKNGKTNIAGETNLSVFEFPVGDTKRPVVFIVLNSSSEKEDTKKLREYTLNNFR